MHSFSNPQSQETFDPDVDVPESLRKYLTTVEDPINVYSLTKENRANRAQLLSRRFYNQIQYGCKNSSCDAPTCLSYRKRSATGPVRLYNEVTARALAIRCVERYVHRGRDIDRVPRRDKIKKVSLQGTSLNDGLCCNDPVVPWYVDGAEYISKKKSATRKEDRSSKTMLKKSSSTSPCPTTHEAPVCSNDDTPIGVNHEDNTTQCNSNRHPRVPASQIDLIFGSASATANTTSSLDSTSPNDPPITQTRLDTSSLAQSLFGAPALIQTVEKPCPLRSLPDGNPAEQHNNNDVANPAGSSFGAPSVRGLTKIRTFALLPASAMLYLKHNLVASDTDNPGDEPPRTAEIKAFVDQSIFFILTDPRRLLISASTWDKYVPYSEKTGLPTDFVTLAEAETCTTTDTLPFVLPDWRLVCWICRGVLHQHHGEQDHARIFYHLQQLVQHAYICPPWLGSSSHSNSEDYLDNRTVAYVICLTINIAFGMLRIRSYDEFSTEGYNPFLPHVAKDSTSEEWVYRPDIMQLAVSIASVLSYRHSLDIALTSKFGSCPDTRSAKTNGAVRTLVSILSDSKMLCTWYDDILNEYASTLLDMMVAVIVMRWDRSPIISRSSPVAGALQVLKGLYRVRKQCHLLQARFVMYFIGNTLDELDMPHEWLEFQPDAERIHILQFPFLLPDESLVAYFRSINLKIMKRSYDQAMGTYTIGNAQLLLSKWNVRNVHEVLQKTRPHMARYFVMTVRRDHMLEDAIGQVWHREYQELVRPLKVRMGEEDGEVGLDHGGVQQELFRLMFNDAFNPDYGMFDVDSKTRTTWFQPGSVEPLYKYEALGLLVSLAVYNGISIPMNMPIAFYRIILGLKVKTIEHIEDGWPVLAKSFEDLLKWEDGDVGDVMCRTYEFCYEAFGKIVNIDMTRAQPADQASNSGSDSSEAPLVTNANREAFVKDYIIHLTSKSVQPQLQAFLKGVKTLLSPQAMSLFPPERLKVLFEGHPTSQSIDLAAWKATTTYEDYSVSDPVISWFWEVLREDFSQEQLRKLLEFVTASDRIPIGGWNGITFIIQRNAAGNEWLPASSTCYGRLFLPEYSSKDILRAKLEKAIETNYGFGMV